jgi:arylsulfatase A-like enzyme
MLRGAWLSAAGGCLARTALASFAMNQDRETPGRDRPNIVVILVDDLGYGDLGCYGGEIRTPNIDALAKNGLRFTDFHSNAAVCSPTRASLLTGRYPHRLGIQGALSDKKNQENGLALEETTFAELLGKSGYDCGIFGKWHLGFTPRFGPTRQGFKTFRGLLGGDLDYHSHIGRGGERDWWMNERLVSGEGYSTDLLAQYAIDFIEHKTRHPFLVYLPFQAVHFPFQGPADKADRTAGVDYHSESKYGSRKDRKAAYKEMVEAVDAAVGRVVSALRRRDLERETLLFLTSDNGGFSMVSSNKPLRGGKGELWEGGHRVPAVACWPGKIKPGSVTDQTAMTMDLFPTLAALAGVPLPGSPKIDGIDLTALLKEGRPLPERSVFWRAGSTKAARRGPWKLMLSRNERQLFHLNDDIGETRNLASSDSGRAKNMERELLAWEKEVTEGVQWISRQRHDALLQTRIVAACKDFRPKLL